jgi:putative tryptophan/tyrosine transport system substrate-binding protein
VDRLTTGLSRRRFVLGAGTAGGALLVGCGPLPFQRPAPTAVKIHRVGFLSGGSPASAVGYLGVFRQALGELGYVEGQNLIIEYRWGEGDPARLAEPVAELAQVPMDVFVVPSTTVGQVAAQVTATVPIVMAGTGDPVELSLAASYARPGGNVTGITNLGRQLTGKRLQLLKEAAPAISRVAVFWGSATTGPFSVEAFGRDAQVVGVQLYLMEPRGPEEFDDAFESAAREGADALFVNPTAIASANAARVVQLAARLRWPAMYYQRQFVEEGGLMAYEASLADLWRRAAVYVDKILRGASPAEIPVEQAMRFDLVVNAKAARELAITFPPEMQLQITEVIE